MSVDQVEVLVEEPSMAAALTVILPGLLGSTTWAVHEHTSKQDLLKKLPNRLRGYSRWLPATSRIVVIVDRDDDSCADLKEELEQIALTAGLKTKSSPGRDGYTVVNRIAVEELEAWFFGDWSAVCTAYPRVDPHVPAQRGFRDPDGILGGTWEAFERVLQRAGYFSTGLRKVEAARAVAEHMKPARNVSPSFRALRTVLESFAQ
ncbi:MAG: DUF4276 family protein [Myxococcaceae bacterium]|nr:DUF4276 family protein [Myxococcaceae bacterium]